MKTLCEWLSKIEYLHPDTINLGLDRIVKVANRLDVMAFDCPVITVAGTNGKGSCVKFLESIIHCAGYRVGTYNSPHLLSFNERVRIANQNVADADLVTAFEVIEKMREGTPLTFFEFTTLAALWLFKQAKLDALILEVGLGGRLDAVNVVDSDIGIITTIDFDHMDWLGNTREKIALEKAGIFRQEGYAICGDPDPPEALLHYARKLRTQFYCFQKHFRFEASAKNWSWYSNEQQFLNLPLPTLPIQNAVTSLMAIQKLTEYLDISEYAIANGIKFAKLQGRFQIVDNPFPCILDVAHNPASARMLAEQLESKTPNDKFIAVVGMLADKDIANTIKPLLPKIDHWYFGNLNVSRGASALQMAKQLQAFNHIKCYTYDCIANAFLAAANNLYPGNKILVFGSFYTVAEVLNMLKEDNFSHLPRNDEALMFDQEEGAWQVT